MTVREFIKVLKKLEQNREIYVSRYDDLHGDIHYDNPLVMEETADVMEHNGRDFLAKWRYTGKKLGERLIYILGG